MISYSKIELTFVLKRKEKANQHEGYNKPADKTYKNGKAKIRMLCGYIIIDFDEW